MLTCDCARACAQAALQDMTVIINKDSKTVKHGLDMIRHLKQAKGDLATALWQKDGYIVETLEEEIAAAEQGQKDTNGKLKFTLEQGGMKQQLKNEVHVGHLKLVDWHTEW